MMPAHGGAEVSDYDGSGLTGPIVVDKRTSSVPAATVPLGGASTGTAAAHPHLPRVMAAYNAAVASGATELNLDNASFTELIDYCGKSSKPVTAEDVVAKFKGCDGSSFTLLTILLYAMDIIASLVDIQIKVPRNVVQTSGVSIPTRRAAYTRSMACTMITDKFFDDPFTVQLLPAGEELSVSFKFDDHGFILN
jgi:hypothetical protein